VDHRCGVPDRVEVSGEDGGAIPVRLTLQETLERICEFYNLDPKLAKPQLETVRIETEPSKNGDASAR
jgi:hypothetical protein